MNPFPPIPIKSVIAAFTLVFITGLTGCGGSGGSSGSDDDTTAETNADTGSATDTGSSADNSSSNASDTSTAAFDVITASVNLADCQLDSDIASIACAANAWLDTLSADELATAQLEWSDSEARTGWSNLPVGNVTRNGLRLDAMDEESKEAALVVAKAVLSDTGFEDMIAGFAADEYLQTLGGNGYDKEYYYFAIFGYPEAANDWMLQIGGHHMAYNITFISGEGYPVPHHLGAEPKVTFTVNSNNYSELEDEAATFIAMYDGLTDSELDYAYLSGESFSDVLMGPDNGSGELPDDYPTVRGGMLVSDLTSDQQALVTAAIASYVADYTSDISDPLLEAYTSDEAYAQTYVAWAGSQSAGVDIDTNGTYMRIDGPRVWIEIICQGGIIIRNETHYHTIFRDKTMDYGNSL